MEPTIEVLMGLLQNEVEHCRHLCDFKEEAERLEYIWSTLEDKLVEKNVIQRPRL